MNTVNWGILSTAKIGVKKVIPAMQQSELCSIVGIASRDSGKAEEVAGELGIPRSYGSYKELLDDADIDAVYIPLPNNLHVEWSIQALKSGKHVLCEKPIGMNADEAKQLLGTARQFPSLKIMEGFMYRHHPQWQYTKKCVVEGRLGDLQTIQSIFTYYKSDPDNIRHKPEMGGGGLMDIGCYPISVARFLFEREPDRIFGSMKYDQEFRVDYLTSGLLDFTDGTASFTCSTQASSLQKVQIFGTRGRIELDAPFNPPRNGSTSIMLNTEDESKEITFDPCNQFTIQGELFSKAVIDDTPVPTPLSDAVSNMEVIDAVVESSVEGKWVSIEQD